MCGIAGIRTARVVELRAIDEMTDALAHRGPDDRGVANFDEAGVALGMRRLSIVDLTHGHQPMSDENGNVHVVFNGEIYNFRQLRSELTVRGHRFVTDHSDTEVLVHGYEEWRDDLFPRLNGMFAVAIFDRRDERLVLARDRMGEKPLYYGRIANGYVFGSELKSLLAHPGMAREIDATALAQYLSFDFVLSPRSILANISKVPPGHIADLDVGGVSVRPYWSPSFKVDPQLSLGGATRRLDELLEAAVERRLMTDVPLGLFLSGGLDSTTVGYYMTRKTSDVQSFSIGFEESAYDESDYAAIAAQALGTKHHVEILSQKRVQDMIFDVAHVLDEPMGDPSVFPMYLLSRFTREFVKVALGGDGSDELLMGYRTYPPLRLAALMANVPQLYALGGVLENFPAAMRVPAVYRIARLLARVKESPSDRLLTLLGAFAGDCHSVLSPDARQQVAESALEGASLISDLGPLNPMDATVGSYLRGYLAEDILVKVDRASMAASLEVRAPFLDPDVVDFVLSLPVSYRLRGWTGKYVLRKLMRGRIPEPLISRRKQGFGAPIGAWLRESLRPLVKTVLSPSALAADGLLDARGVTTLVNQHLDGTHDHGSRVWLLLQYAMWKEVWLRPR